MKFNGIKFIGITIIVLFLSHYIAVFLHEYAHSFMAWLLGFKSNPLALNYGTSAWSNILLLLQIDQNVDNNRIYALGYPKMVALIAFSGMGVNLLFYLISLFYLNKQNIAHTRPVLYYFLFFFNLMNLGNIYDYIPIRIFATSGYLVDILDIEQGLGVSPWVIYILAAYPITLMIWNFFYNTQTALFRNLQIKYYQRCLLTVITIAILFGYFGLPGFFSNGDIPVFISTTSLLLIPGVLFLLWPSRQ